MTLAARRLAFQSPTDGVGGAWPARAFWRVKGRILLLAAATFVALC